VILPKSRLRIGKGGRDVRSESLTGKSWLEFASVHVTSLITHQISLLTIYRFLRFAVLVAIDLQRSSKSFVS
jgi:hypothetical protein